MHERQIASYIGRRGGVSSLGGEEKKALATVAEAAQPKRKNKTFEVRAREALGYALADIKRHPEYQGRYGQAPRIEVEKRGRDKAVYADVLFDKYGSEIFVVRPEDDDGDYDWPEFVGGRIIQNILDKAAKKAGLGKDTKLMISPSEKGWLDVGYQRAADPAERKKQADFERNKKKLVRAAREFVKIFAKHPDKVKLDRTPKINSVDISNDYGGWMYSVEVLAKVKPPTEKRGRGRVTISGNMNTYNERGKGWLGAEMDEALRKAGLAGSNASHHQDIDYNDNAVFQFLLKP